jgi:hypothetical protein
MDNDYAASVPCQQAARRCGSSLTQLLRKIPGFPNRSHSLARHTGIGFAEGMRRLQSELHDVPFFNVEQFLVGLVKHSLAGALDVFPQRGEEISLGQDVSQGS